MQTIAETAPQTLPPLPVAAEEINETTAAETPRAHKWTKAEYYRIAELGFFAGKRVELIEGEIIEMAAMNVAHATAVRLALAALTKVFAEGFVVDSQLPFDISENSEPLPDVAVIAGDIRDFIHAHPRDAALLVEISDTTLRYDRLTKQRLYATKEIQEYWIVNINARCLEVYRRPVNDSYAEIFVFYEQDAVAPLAKPEARIMVADLLP